MESKQCPTCGAPVTKVDGSDKLYFLPDKWAEAGKMKELLERLAKLNHYEDVFELQDLVSGLQKEAQQLLNTLNNKK